MIVDDIPTNLKVAEGLLSPYNAKIDTCLSGAEAIELVKKNKYDLIFMDHMMPDMDGIEATAIIRKLEKENEVSGNNGKQIIIVALTANAVVGMKEMFLEKGFNDFLSKPVDVSKMDEILDRWIEKRTMSNEQLAMNNDKLTINNEQLQNKNTNCSLLIDHCSLPIIPNVDTAKGVAMVRGSLKAYMNILSMFCKDVDERLPKLQIIPKEDSLPAFIIQVHSLKSVTASIGAKEVSAKAAGLEAAGKNADLAFISGYLPEFTEQLAEVVKNIRAAITSPST